MIQCIYWTIIIIFIILLIVVIYFEFKKERFIENFKQHCSNRVGTCSKNCPNIKDINYFGNLTTIDPSIQYNKSIAQILSSISFGISNSICKKSLVRPPGFTKSVNLNSYGYILISKRIICIVFSGTLSLSELKSDLDYKQINIDDNILVHEGFYKIYLSIQDIIKKTIENTNFNHLYITGHSLGGALSTLCAFDLRSRENITHYSFASPRVGNVKFAEEFNRSKITSFRVNNTEDLIPALPLATWKDITYEHVGLNIPFTISLGSLMKNHMDAYRDYLPN